MTPATVRRTPAPKRALGRLAGILSGVLMPLFAALALSVAPAHAEVDAVARGLAANSPRASVTYTPSTTAWTMTSVGPDVGALASNPQGYSTDGANNFLGFRTALFKLNNDASWSTAVSNSSPFAGITSVNHLGGIKVDGSLVYVAVMNFTSCGVFSNEKIVTYNKSDLTLSAQTDVSAQATDVSGLAIDHDNNLIWVSSFCSPTTLQKYNLTTKAYIGSLTITGLASLTNVQDVAYSNGTLYITGNQGSPAIEGVFSVDPSTGAGARIWSNPDSGGRNETEGLDVVNGSVALLQKTELTHAFVATFTPPNVAITRAALATSPTSGLGINSAAPTDEGAHAFGGLNLGPHFSRYATAPGWGLFESGLGIGSSAPDAMLMIVKNGASTAGTGGAFAQLPACSHYISGTTSNVWTCATDATWGWGANYMVWGAGTSLATANIKMAMKTDGGLILGFTAPSTHPQGLGTINVSAGLYVNDILVGDTGHIVSGLPTCNTAAKGARSFVTDASSPTFLATLTGGSSTVAPAFCNGTNWVAY